MGKLFSFWAIPYLLALLIFTVSAIYITYPLIFHLGDMVTGYGDELLIAWIQNWVVHALATNPFMLFDANTYYPYANSLAFSDLFLTSAILAALPLYLIGEPIAAFNFTLLSSLILLGFSVFLLSYYLTKDYFASVFSGILVIFSPAVLDKKVHVQVLALQWIPLAILFFFIFQKTKHYRYLVFAMLCFLLQAYNSFLPGYFLVFFFSIYLIYLWFINKQQFFGLFVKKNVLIVGSTLLLLIPVALPYFTVSREFRAVRDFRDTIHFALQPEDLYYPSEHTRLNSVLMQVSTPENFPYGYFKPGYLGAVFSVLAIVAFLYFFRTFNKKQILFNVITITGVTGLVLSFGPALHLGRQTIHYPFPIPLPYAIFYFILPGFQGFRNTARWEMLFVLCIAVVIAAVLVKLLRGFGIKTRVFLYLLLCIGVIAEFNFPMRFLPLVQKDRFPEVYQWLQTTPNETSIIILPAYNWNSPYASDEIMREYYSIIHFRRTVNGYSGFSPPPWQELLVTLQKNFPDEKTISILRGIGVDYIIVDKEGYKKNYHKNLTRVNEKEVIKVLQSTKSVNMVRLLGNYVVFSIVD